MKKIKIIFDLIGVVSKDGYIATNIIYPLVKDTISYELFKKKYLLYCIGNIENKDFWYGIVPESEINYIEHKIIDNVQINLDIASLINKYSSQNIDIYIASEIPTLWGNMILNKAKIFNSVKKKFYSSELKATKPLKNFYNNIFTPELFNDSLVLYIDDTEDNVRTAHIDYKVKSILFNGDKNDSNEYLCAQNASEIDKIIKQIQ